MVPAVPPAAVAVAVTGKKVVQVQLQVLVVQKLVAFANIFPNF